MVSQSLKVGETYNEAYRNATYLQKLDNFWEDWGDTPIKAAVRIVGESFPKDSSLSLADLGCGTGRDLARFNKLLLEAGYARVACIGCETSSEAVQLCKDRGIDVTLEDSNTFLRKSDTSFSMLWSHFSLIHLSEEELAQAITSYVKKLSPSGVLGIGFKSAEGQRLADDGYGVTRHTTYFRHAHVEKAIRQQGLVVRASISIPGTTRPIPYQYSWVIATRGVSPRP